jgi:hypothetical protein
MIKPRFPTHKKRLYVDVVKILDFLAYKICVAIADSIQVFNRQFVFNFITFSTWNPPVINNSRGSFGKK